MWRFWLIVAGFLFYTVFQAAQLWPGHALGAAAISVALFAVMLGAIFIYRARASVFERRWFRTLAWMGSLSMATWATFILFSIPVIVVGALALAAHVYSQPWSWRIHAGLLAFSAALVLAGFLQMRRGPRVRAVTIRLPNLAPAFRGFKIAQFSDLHVGPTLRHGYVENVVQKINATNPDLIVFTGDMADARATEIRSHLEPLRHLKSRYGAFFVTGNHEYYWGADELLAQARTLGFTTLANENTTVSVDGAKLLVAGVTDAAGEMVQGHAPDFAKAAQSTSSADVKILLAHRPEASVEAEPLGFDLQFSGHTHSGQFFPFNLLIGLFHKYSRGLYQHGRMWVYVNPGTGYWGPADRLGVSPEITLVTLDV
jgi:predicted MPP superfamily phosphohydrolase